MARTKKPQSNINLNELFVLSAAQCTQMDLAGWFGISHQAIEKRMKSPALHDFVVPQTAGNIEPPTVERLTFREISERGKSRGLASLRHAQYKLAMSGHCGMQIWLGKQLLGQRDVTPIELSGPAGGPIEHSTTDAGQLLRSRIAGIAQRLGAGSPAPNGHA